MEKNTGSYAKLWPRIIAHLIDSAVFVPLLFAALYFERQSKLLYIVFTLMSGLLYPLYDVYFNTRGGQTPGKMVAKIKVVTSEFKAIGFKAAMLRSSVSILQGASYAVVGLVMISTVSEFNYVAMPLMEFGKTLAELTAKSPLAEFESYLTTFSYVWTFAGLLAVITSRQRRAVHDLIAGTVVVSTLPEPSGFQA
jgi:uncharacterized RDD family membrane protein YckC